MKNLALFIFVYTFTYVGLAVNLTDAGHGTTLFLAPLTPLGIPWFAMVAAVLVLSREPNFTKKVVFSALMSLHYLVTLMMIMFMWSDSVDGVFRIWTRSPLWVLLTTAVYLLGQIGIWVLFVRRTKVIP